MFLCIAELTLEPLEIGFCLGGSMVPKQPSVLHSCDVFCYFTYSLFLRAVFRDFFCCLYISEDLLYIFTSSNRKFELAYSYIDYIYILLQFGW